MTRAIWLMGFMICTPLAVSAADEGRFSFLEQEVRRLQQQVTAMSRRIDQLERPVAPAPGAPKAANAAPAPSSDAWIEAGKWKKVRPGMRELEVISLLGPPTSMREIEGARVLFYAREIGASGFLGGSVKIRDRVVVQVQEPVLQ